ncbi:hepatocellular carcinoma-associated antigen 59-domain-containing protein [Gigaspora rosea]|uniref:Hepatocellular carcinoma-associated antigen 59-domain-containing protein n=1 Tax=Gigaspora rosea TaxID=44941 RepID=A0A397UCN7_9GLOM|nr:hepatocellular carcinoma-associated antigen 59-domain-containing protein [Gigaspora rosea]
MFSNYSEPIEDLIELRKFRRRHQGIDAEKLMKGEARVKKKKKDEDPWKLTTGGIVDLEAVREAEKEEEEEEDSAERKIMLDSFTKQTNALDVDKHIKLKLFIICRMAFIEDEMRKRRGQISDSKNEVEDAEHTDPLNPQDELFQAPDHLRIESKPISEGNVQLSTTMLTAIPEVDLGIDVRLKNIEETEKAKRKLLEQRHQKPKEEDDTFEGSNFSATNRFYRTRTTVSDHERNQQEQVHVLKTRYTVHLKNVHLKIININIRYRIFKINNNTSVTYALNQVYTCILRVIRKFLIGCYCVNACMRAFT